MIPPADVPFLFASPPGSQTAAPPDAHSFSSMLLALSPPSYLAGDGRGLWIWSGPWPGSLEPRRSWAGFYNLCLLLVYIVLRHQSINHNICEQTRASLQQCTLSLSSTTCFLMLSSQPLCPSLTTWEHFGESAKLGELDLPAGAPF